jgi:hypothetical protein
MFVRAVVVVTALSLDQSDASAKWAQRAKCANLWLVRTDKQINRRVKS